MRAACSLGQSCSTLLLLAHCLLFPLSLVVCSLLLGSNGPGGQLGISILCWGEGGAQLIVILGAGFFNVFNP